MAEIRHIGIVGCGLSGSAIARIAALSGYYVTMCEVSQEVVQHIVEKNTLFFKRQMFRGKISDSEMYEALSRLQATINIADLNDHEIIIEAVPENLAAKIRIMEELDRLCSPHTILTSHTSALSITHIAKATRHPDRVLGLHFFQPIHRVKLVEIIQTTLVDQHIVNMVETFIHSLNKEPIIVKDTPGFVVNRLLIGYFFNAVRLVESGIATQKDIDKAMEAGCGYPLGPFALMDFLGLDHVCKIGEHLYQEYQEEQYAPPRLLTQLIAAGHLGKKTGKGFYDYT